MISKDRLKMSGNSLKTVLSNRTIDCVLTVVRRRIPWTFRNDFVREISKKVITLIPI
jgi:hypothetical protein